MRVYPYIKLLSPVLLGLMVCLSVHAQEGQQKEEAELYRLKNEIQPVLDEGGEPDIPNAFNLIELIAGLEVDSLYPLANELYFSILSENVMSNQPKLLKEELNRLKPIVDNSVYKNWGRLLKKKDERLIPEIRRYWELADPVLATSYNERLIEHWRRVYLAKREYTINNKSGFGTDDRGSLYVKLGKPHQVKESSVSLSNYSDPMTGSQIPIENNIYFRFEIWYYDEVQYIFGVPGNGGPFGLQSGILDLIPESGNRPGFYFDPTASLVELTNNQSGAFEGGATSTQNTSLASPGSTLLSRKAASLLLQYSVLEHIATFDPFYLDLYNRMSSDLIQNAINGSANTFNRTALTQNLKYRALEKNWYERKRMATPSYQSDAFPEAQYHITGTHFYDFLYENGTPYKLMITESTDYSKVQLFLAADTTVKLSEISKADNFYVFDQSWIKSDEQGYTVALSSPNYNPMNSYLIDISEEEKLFQSGFIYSDDAAGSNTSSSIISVSRAVKIPNTSYVKQEFEQLGFSFSDLIVARDQEESSDHRIPFFPSIDRAFDVGGEMIVYFEGYGIPKGEYFALEYGKEDKSNKVNVSFVSDSSSTKVWFKLELDEDVYTPGEHEILFTLSYRGKKIERKVSITIVE